MNYTKLVREYCKNNSGAIFDVSKLKDTEFAEVPYKTLLKILNRLEEEGLLKPVSKGVYFIGEKPVRKPAREPHLHGVLAAPLR